jgi:oligosaccharide repeat unit polymerase
VRATAVVLLAGAAVAALVLGFEIQPGPIYVVAVGGMILSALLVSHASGLNLRRLAVPAVWYVSYLASTAIPGMVVVANNDSPYVTPFLFAVLSTLFTAPLGMLVVNLAAGFRRDQTRAFFEAPVERRDPPTSEVSAYLLLLAVCLALTAGFIVETPVIPLLHLIQNPGSAAILVTLREESFKLLDSPFIYAYDVLRNVVYPFLIALALGYYLTSRRLRWLVLFLVTAAAGLFYAAVSVAKAPVAVIVLVAVLFAYLYLGGRVGLRAAAAGFSAVFLFPLAVLFQSLSGLGFSAADIGTAILRRLFYVPAEVLYNYFVVVPDVVPYLYGRTIGRVQWILGESSVNIGNFVFRFMYPERIESGVANASFLGYLHADFGVPGILLGGVLVGALMQGLQVWLTRRPKTVMTLAAYSYLLWVAWKVNFQSLPQIVLSGGVIVILLLVGLLRQAASFFRLATAGPQGQMAKS